MRARGLVGWVALALGAASAPGVGAAETIHGGDSTFVGRDVAIVWGVLAPGGPVASSASPPCQARAGYEETAPEELGRPLVVLRIAALGPALGTVAIDVVDPFGGRRLRVLPPSAVAPSLDLWLPRECFTEFPRLELGFTPATGAPPGSGAVTIYFVGVPDTTPELTSPTALAEYLAAALGRARRRATDGAR